MVSKKVIGTARVEMKRLLPMIESHRAEGYKIPQIYESLPPEFKERVAFGTFRNTYYKMRQDHTTVAEETLPLSTQVVSSDRKEEPKKLRSKIGIEQTIAEHQAIARAAFKRR